MMGGMGMLWLIGLVALLVLVGVGAYLGVRLARPRLEGDSPRALLERRLAAGEIDVDEYYEREAAIRAGERPRR